MPPKKQLRRFLIKISKSLIILACLSYLLFIWQVKQGVDKLFQQSPYEWSLDYQWLYVDWLGHIQVFNIKLYDLTQNDLTQKEVISAEKLSIQLNSIVELTTLEGLIIYQNFPKNIQFKLANAYFLEDLDSKTIKNSLPQDINIIPPHCKQAFQQKVGGFQFDWSGKLSFNATSESLHFHSKFETISLFDINVSGQIDNISNANYQNSYLASLAINVDEHVWLNQALNRCMQHSQSSRGEVAQLFKRRFRRFYESKFYIVNPDFLPQLSEFIFNPQQINLNYTPKVGYSWQQLDALTFEQLIHQAELILTLNDNPATQLFQSFDSAEFLKAKSLSRPKSNTPSVSYLPKNINGLKGFIGAHITLHLKNKDRITGYLDGIKNKRILLRQHRFGGQSVLPYKLIDVEFISLLK